MVRHAACWNERPYQVLEKQGSTTEKWEGMSFGMLRDYCCCCSTPDRASSAAASDRASFAATSALEEAVRTDGIDNSSTAAAAVAAAHVLVVAARRVHLRDYSLARAKSASAVTDVAASAAAHWNTDSQW